MADTIQTICNNILYRLSDQNQEVWGVDELHGYIKEAYEQIAATTHCFMDTLYLDDQELIANFTCMDDLDYIDAEDEIYGLMSYTSDADKEYLEPGQLGYGPIFCTSRVDLDYMDDLQYQAVHDLPENLLQIERVTWNGQRIDPVHAGELEWGDAQYRTQGGQVIGYLQEQDGVKRFRKWRVPSMAADRYTYTGAFGLLRDVSDVSDETLIGSWGIVRRLPGEMAISGTYPWGTARRVWQDIHNTKIEFSRKGSSINSLLDVMELPDRYVKYVKYYAIARALQREGPGQDLKLGEFWASLYQRGIGRIKKRLESFLPRETFTLGSNDVGYRQPPTARMPANYGRVIPWPSY